MSLDSGRWSRAKRDGGFALLITVTLLAFIVILLLGLAVYTRVETAAAGNTQRQAQARENAVFALNIALGQLQKYAGPDQRVTATAESFSPAPAVAGDPPPNVAAQKVHYTGVWDSTASGTEPLAWLASGLESATPVDITAAIPAARRATLIGSATDRSATANNTVAELQEIRVAGVPGVTGNTTAPIGRYAWWIGDQGVKAPVAINDRAVTTTGTINATTTVSYPPYDSTEMRRRIRQQVSLGGGPANRSDGTAVFEPRTSSGTNPNSTLANNTVAFNQLAFFKNASGTQIGLRTAQSNFHAWTSDNAAVLANTKDGGLRRDLSLRPDLLGSAFTAWADYPSYMEDPTNPLSPSPLPAYGDDPIRRRYRITPETSDQNVVHSVHPVLSFFFIQFNVRPKNGDVNETALEVRARMVAGLWNPWSSALVPEEMRLEISGLPDLEVTDSNGGISTIKLQELFGSPMAVALKFEDATASGSPDLQSWLPGRVYNWRTQGGAPGAWLTEFYRRELSIANADIWTVLANASYSGLPAKTVTLALSGPAAQLTLNLMRASDSAPLGTYISPSFDPVQVPPQTVDTDEYVFGYPFRLVESVDTIADPANPYAWMTTSGRDVRQLGLPTESFATLGGTDPNIYVGVGGNAVFTDRNRLLDRGMGSGTRSYNEDVPVFELPRSPLLSLGALQHLQISGARPFTIGNPWGNGATVGTTPANALFDRYFFSGLAAPVTGSLTDEMLAAPVPAPLPNPLLKVLPQKSDGSRTLYRDVLGKAASIADPTEGYSSAHLLQRGAFNLNSTNATAWLAMLRSTRYANGVNFTFLNASTSTGTNGDTSTRNVTPADAVFYRFPQSAQETYEADDPVTVIVNGASEIRTYAASNTATGADPNEPSTANTHLFRRGMKVLDAAQTTALATAIAQRIADRVKASGPFRSLEEFLNEGIIDAAIADVPSINQNPDGSPIEFSSQFLTQADVMTALAPVLFPRSDTFVIRAYGEAVNPALLNGNGSVPNTAIEGRAWCEAVVQRVPEYFDPAADDAAVLPADLTSDLNKTYGRRFRIVSFRWLSRSDI